MRILDELKELGFASQNISVVRCAKDKDWEPAAGATTNAPPEQPGAAEEGLFGGAIDWLSCEGSLDVPGLGRITAAGPLLAHLKVRNAPHNLTGRLVRLGVPESAAQRYENQLCNGKILISHHSASSELVRRAAALFRKADADDITLIQDDSSQESGSGAGGQRGQREAA